MKFTKFIFSLFVIFLASHLVSQSILENKINHFMAEIADNEKPGCAIGVIKSGEILLAKGYGLANLEHRITFTEKTISDIGSVAKQFTCMAITMLENSGQLSLDDEIQKHLPYIPYFGSPITIRHLVHHTSGIREI